MLWNSGADDPAPWQVELGALLVGLRDPSLPFVAGRPRDWAGEVAAAGGFTPVASRTFAHEQLAEAEDVVAGALSTSWVAVLAEDRRRRFADDVRRALAPHPTPLVVRWRTEVHWCRRT
jgi:hypothetical protein